MKRPQFFSREGIIPGANCGELSIISMTSKVLLSGQRKASIVAQCSCGTTVETLVDNILVSPHPMCKNCLTLGKRSCKIGDRFDKLVVIGFSQSKDRSCNTLAVC